MNEKTQMKTFPYDDAVTNMLTINQQSITYGMMITAKTFYSYFHKLLNFPNYYF